MENHEQNVQQAYSKMAQLCSRSEQCSADIRKKILTYEIVDEIVDEIIEKLIAEKYIDDERFARAYVNDKFRFNKWGRVKMRFYLRQKGLSDATIEKGLEKIDEEKYIKVLVKIMKDKAKTIKNKDRFTKMGQIIRYTQGRGFEPELIHRHMNEVLD
ncbi:regulatory protein [Draconibacterium orientale]|jgi:regulatory protein|uniref:Regulatory protein RecX n=1 Tax=Draconibacterium orientale TaxID=1168034 RepID=X5E061_9BACT|nr:regulatory protein RecX [Draconibacterium orientale]AHW59951.1 regulatory protein [Draconibacterium orientale]SET41059.1 regulatory protein [Draconibacterium orientale]